MGLIITKENFNEIMDRIDTELEEEKTSIEMREFAAVAKLAHETNYEGAITNTTYGTEKLRQTQSEFEGLNLFAKVGQWYKNYWEHHMKLNNSYEFPVLIRGAIFFIKIPFCYGSLQIDIRNQVPSMTDMQWDRISKDEKQIIVDTFAIAFNYFYSIEEIIQSTQLKIPDVAKNYLTTGYTDITTAISAIQIKNYQNCCFHSQQAVEKYIKAYLLIKNIKTEKALKAPDIRHNLLKLFDLACESCQALYYLKKDLQHVSYTMDVRYKVDESITDEKAISSIHTALSICHLIVNSLFDLHKHII